MPSLKFWARNKIRRDVTCLCAIVCKLECWRDW